MDFKQPFWFYVSSIKPGDLELPTKRLELISDLLTKEIIDHLVLVLVFFSLELSL